MEAMCEVGYVLIGGRETAEVQVRQIARRASQERGKMCIGEAMTLLCC
ncbi:hypothetical protein KDA_46690 [Dictyobacter alpinus]|uniref:Uncharacterized protein n=1 Tax=Dictyobacter alpinus TaxID=2014873 RepID=A0A402BCU7_9CHLR|nr:hypothetical protein [Dictyobacter alpinus]GCE24524.1 hypothetical protein KDA_00080 [Dictyobacter alpinus]GCE29170.1 hypothetical protein KDA_46540 [Dictyobacter alpinus]GCE29185.1 hypothetical protein KDA_46690 [Dictyobacter alpinus]